jgi:glycerophosphoryl diester phosphodiesterase
MTGGERQRELVAGITRRSFHRIAAASALAGGLAIEPVFEMDRSAVPGPPALFRGPPPDRWKWSPSFDVVAHAFHPHSHIDSMDGIRRAFANGRIVGIDLDVRISHNGVPVLYHDPLMYRQLNPWPVEFFNDDVLAGKGIALLDAAYELVPHGKFLALDVKTGYGWVGSPRRTMLAVADMLLDHPERRAKTRMWFHRSDVMEEFRMIMAADAKAHPGRVDVQAGMSTSVETPSELQDVLDEGFVHYAEAVSAPFVALDEETVDYAHRRGIYLYCWDIQPDEYARAIGYGVDCINADDLALATTLMAKAAGEHDHAFVLV